MKADNTLASVQLKETIEQLKQDDSTLLQAYSEYASNNGYDSVYDNDEDSINMMFSDSHDAIRAAFYGDYNPSHAYFTFNGYGNLQSFEYLQDDNSPIDIEELAQWIIDNELYNDYDLSVTTLDDMLASIEDNITDDDYLISKLYKRIYKDKLLLIDLANMSNEERQFIIGQLMGVISDYNYNQINDIINHLNINYK